MPSSSSLAYTVAGASSTWSGSCRTRKTSLRSTSPSAAGWGGGGGSGWPGIGPPPHRPPWCPRLGPARRWPGRSLLLAAGRLGCRHGAVGGELLQQRRELSLDLDDLAGLVELAGQALVLPAQPGVVAFHRIGRRAALWLGQRLERAPVTLLAPLAEQRRVQALTAQQRALAGLVQALILGQDLGLVARRVGPRPRSLGDLGVMLHHASLCLHLGGSHRRHLLGVLSRPPLTVSARQASHERLTQRGPAA